MTERTKPAFALNEDSESAEELAQLLGRRPKKGTATDAIAKEIEKLEKQVDAAGWRRGANREPLLAGTLQEVAGVGTLFHPHAAQEASELIDPARLDLKKRHHVVFRLRALRAALAEQRTAAEREERRRNREALDAQADQRRAEACKQAGITLDFVDDVKKAMKIINDASLWRRI